MITGQAQDENYSVLDLGFDKLLTLGTAYPQTNTPEMTNAFSGGTSAASILSGDLISNLKQKSGTLFNGKTGFDNNSTGYILGVDTSDSNKIKFYIGSTTNYLNWDGSNLTISGSITATSGYFGSVTNGVQITSTGLTIIGSGYIGTDVSPNSRIQMLKSVTGGFTDGLVAYDSSNNLIFRLIMSGGYPPLTMFGTSNNQPLAQFLGGSSSSDYVVKITAAGTDDGLRVELSGNRSASYAGLRVNIASLLGNGLTLVKSGGNVGDALQFSPEASAIKLGNIFRKTNPGSGWTNTLHEARITDEGYIQFPAYHHRSEFDEYIGGATLALASSVIAKAYWVGGGTAGTQTLVSDINADVNTYINLSTTSTASRTSTLTFGRYISIGERVVEFRLRISDKTNTKITFGFYDASSTHYAWFKFDTAADANKIYAECYGGSSTTTTDTGVTMGTTAWHSYRIVQYAGPFTYFYIDDVLVVTILNNTDTSPQKPYLYVDNKAAAEEKIIYLDFVNVWKGRDDTSGV